MGILLPMAIMAGISTVSKIVGNRKAAQNARINTNLTVAENKKQADLAYQRDSEAVKAMNLYNSPKSQMERFTDAGLNKNLIYTQGNPGNQSQLAKYNPPTIQYNYLPKWKGNELDSIKDLPLQYYQVKNLMEMGKINQAKAKIETALSEYSTTLATGKFWAAVSQSQENELKALLGFEQYDALFETTQDKTGNKEIRLRPKFAESFVQSLASKYLQPGLDLQKSQKDIEIKDQLLKNLSIVPFLQPLIQFLKLLK